MQSMVRQLLEHPTLGPMVAHHRRLEGAPAQYGEPERPLPVALREALASQGIDRLFRYGNSPRTAKTSCSSEI